MTSRPAMMALVVAIAGIILPAIAATREHRNVRVNHEMQMLTHYKDHSQTRGFQINLL